MKTTAVIMAAGQGTRMKSDLPKVLHPIAGQPLLWHSLQAIQSVSDEAPVVIVGHGAEQVQGGYDLRAAIGSALRSFKANAWGQAMLYNKPKNIGRQDRPCAGHYPPTCRC